MIFDKYWPSMTQPSKDAVWQYLLVLCKLCEKVKEVTLPPSPEILNMPRLP